VNRWVSDKLQLIGLIYRLGRFNYLIADILLDLSRISPLAAIWQPRFIRLTNDLFANSLVKVYISLDFAIFVDSNARNQVNTFFQYSNGVLHSIFLKL
jgi:hypothetical protein